MQRPRNFAPERIATWLAAAALLAWDFGGIDLSVTRLFGDAHGFAWRDSWLTAGLLHQGGRMLAWALLGLLVLDAIRPMLAGPPRRERAATVLATLACLVLVPALKRTSSTSCPWDLREFGGLAWHVPHWAWGVADGGPGHCFPSGHAAAAFAFFSLYLGWKHHRPRLAAWMLIAVTLLGASFGLAQIARGAHHASHVLWSAWLCWVVCLVVQARTAALKWPARRDSNPRPAA